MTEKNDNTSMTETINSLRAITESNTGTTSMVQSGNPVNVSDKENNANELDERLNELIGAAQRGDQTARMRVVGMHAGLVESVAKNYRGMGVDSPELIQAGMEGLLEAVNKFNPARGFQFARYAVWWIKMAMLSRISNQKR